MTNVFVISDLHLGHSRMLTFTSRKDGVSKVRPHETVEEMNETIIDNWNLVVGKRDKVFVCGDVFFGSEDQGLEMLDRLKGNKTLILGNHDHVTPNLLSKFQSVQLWEKRASRNYVISHMPLHPSVVAEAHGDIRKMRVLNIHGHIHEHDSPEDFHWADLIIKYDNVSVERMEYMPAPLDTILERNGMR